MSTAYPPEAFPADTPTNGARHEEDPGSLGEIIGDISEDLSRLFRQEVELAKVELRAEAGKAGKAAGMLAGAGIAALLVLFMLSLALMYALGNVMNLGWAALIVAVLWGAAAAVLYGTGRKKLKDVDPVPRQTVQTLKEDAQWLKNPTS
jgi:uncharacterized membrane protein YqjE